MDKVCVALQTSCEITPVCEAMAQACSSEMSVGIRNRRVSLGDTSGPLVQHSYTIRGKRSLGHVAGPGIWDSGSK